MSLEDDFRQFAEENPHVEQRLVALALDLKRRGYNKGGIGMLFEVLRWQTMMQTSESAAGGFKLNNNYRAFYARLIMSKYPELRGFFEVREQHFPMPDLVAPKGVQQIAATTIVVKEIHPCPNRCGGIDHERDERHMLRCCNCGTTWLPESEKRGFLGC